MLKLFYITHEDSSGSHDLFAWAGDRAEAVRLWCTYFEWDRAEVPEEIYLFIVPTQQPRHATALAWHDEVQELPPCPFVAGDYVRSLDSGTRFVVAQIDHASGIVSDHSVGAPWHRCQPA